MNSAKIDNLEPGLGTWNFEMILRFSKFLENLRLEPNAENCLDLAIGSERIFIVVIVIKWFAFLNKRPQRRRDGHRGNEVGTLRLDIEI